MNEFQEILNRAKLENLTSYLTCGTASDEEFIADKEAALQKAYSKLFSSLESMFPGASRHDNQLFHIILDFAVMQETIYFETGVLAGFQLYQNLNRGSQS